MAENKFLGKTQKYNDEKISADHKHFAPVCCSM